MKKIVVITFVALACCLVACASESEPADEVEAPTATTTEALNAGFGFCDADPTTLKLTGHCRGDGNMCTLGAITSACPIGAASIQGISAPTRLCFAHGYDIGRKCLWH